ncbi:MAG: hypothetical protein Q8920_13090 [Bacillota bacterium]|nr:hypothetical protein [Bacillota bacterium]
MGDLKKLKSEINELRGLLETEYSKELRECNPKKAFVLSRKLDSLILKYINFSNIR